MIPRPAPVDTGDLGPASLQGGVLITIHRLSQGGADRVAMLLANGFADAGLPTRIALLRDGGEGEASMFHILQDSVGFGSAGPPMGSRHLELLRGLGYLRREVAKLDPAVVLASSSNMGLVTGLCARLHRGPRPRYVYKLTNPVIRPSDRSALRRFYRRQLYHFIFGSYDTVLVLSDAERDDLAHMFPQHRQRFVTVPNPYITADMLALAPRSDTGRKDNIVTLARLMPQKRLDVLLRAFAAVDAHCRLTILGDGPERTKLEALAKSLGIASRVEMPGFMDDVMPWLRQADLFVLSSDFEGLPGAVLEALACNVPVVTTDCFAAARSLLVNADFCAVVPLGDVDAFAKAINESLSRHRSPEGLRDIARAYSLEPAIAAHLHALAPLPPVRPGPAGKTSAAGLL